MEVDNIAYYSYLGGSITFTLLLATFAYLWRKQEIHFSILLAALVSILWHLAIASNYTVKDFGISLNRNQLLLLETLRYGSWINALLLSLHFVIGNQLQARYRHIIYGTWVISLLTITSLIFLKHPLINNINLLVWNNLILSIAGISAVEQLFRNTGQRRMMKFFSLSVGALLGYDIYLFSYSLIFGQLDLELWQARGTINTLTAALLMIGSLLIFNQKNQRTALSVSRPVIFYTTSLTVAGGFLSVISLGGYYVQIHGGQWGQVIQVLFLFAALSAICVIFSSKTARSTMNVWISKHFFRHKYDYRVEWLKMINSLTQPSMDENFNLRALHVAASIFKSPGGGLWLQRSNEYIPVQAFNMIVPESAYEAAESTFCRTMCEDDWVFSPHTKDDLINQHLPKWVELIDDLWLVLPLLIENRLIGFIVLTEPPRDASLTWEDLDLLKAVGRQVASYLDRHEAAEQLAESKQFEAFNKLTAFIMHDLKNLIAQQGLVVDNAAKHKDNPAFVEDAIRTIDNSVGRMSNLLRKLQQQEATEIRSLDLRQLLMTAAKKCAEIKPAPSLRFEVSDIRIDADQDLLIMTLANVIKNAQEATPKNGFVDVTLRRENQFAVIIIEDNGSGMDEDFVRNRLFKPFETTKSGKGMGIGVYQTKELIEDMGGQISVRSVPNQGTTFTISIPASLV